MSAPAPDDAITRFQAKVAEKPENELFRFSLAKALIEASRPDEAREHLEVALARRPDWMVVTMLLAKDAIRRGDKTAAKGYYEKALHMAIDQKHEGPEFEVRAALEDLAAE